jgi:competence protein ComEA
MAVGAGVLVAAVATGAWVMAERPRSVAVTASPATAASAARSAAGSGVDASASVAPDGLRTSTGGVVSTPPVGSATASDEVVVDVAGKVRRPGLYRLPAGARVDDAVRAAGGVLAGVNLSSLNLAAKVADGEQIRVGLPGPASVPAPDPATGGGTDGAAGGSGAAAGPVNLNTATSEQLQTLPGVGPVLAQHIIDWRSAHGRFESVDRLNDVPGIGEVKFAALRSRVTV